MKHRITVDGEERELDIRPMDDTFIVDRKLWEPPIRTTDPVEETPASKVYADFFRKQSRAMGSCAMLAWEGDGVVAKMRFTTRETYDAFRKAGGWICVDNETSPKIMQGFSDDELAKLWASESRKLFVTCFNIGHFDTRYHGQGIASAMLECLTSWARDQGWQRIEALSCPDVVPFCCMGPQILRRGWWERRGFMLAAETRADPKEAEGRRREIEKIAAGDWDTNSWDYKSYRFNLEKVKELASDPSWTGVYDKNYVMACDL